MYCFAVLVHTFRLVFRSETIASNFNTIFLLSWLHVCAWRRIVFFDLKQLLHIACMMFKICFNQHNISSKFRLLWKTIGIFFQICTKILYWNFSTYLFNANLKIFSFNHTCLKRECIYALIFYVFLQAKARIIASNWKTLSFLWKQNISLFQNRSSEGKMQYA